MMKGDGYKYNIEAETYIFKRDLALLLEIYCNAEKLVDTKVKETKAQIDKINERIFRESNSSLNEDEQKVHEDFIHYAFHFDYLTLHSLFVSSFSFFENYLVQVSFEFEKYSDSRIKLKDISKDKSDIDRVRKYLNLVHSIQAANTDNKTWQKILVFQKLRNAVVHNNSRFKDEKSKKEHERFLKGYNAHLPRDLSFHIRDKRFLEDFNKCASAFAEDLAEEIYTIK